MRVDTFESLELSIIIPWLIKVKFLDKLLLIGMDRIDHLDFVLFSNSSR